MREQAVFKMLWPDECWHEWEKSIKICNKCGFKKSEGDFGWAMEDYNPDLTTWQGFGIMWERAQECEWWIDFWVEQDKISQSITHGWMEWELHFSETISPTGLLNALYKWGAETGRINETNDQT